MRVSVKMFVSLLAAGATAATVAAAPVAMARFRLRGAAHVLPERPWYPVSDARQRPVQRRTSACPVLSVRRRDRPARRGRRPPLAGDACTDSQKRSKEH